jgi:hypothetical protein
MHTVHVTKDELVRIRASIDNDPTGRGPFAVAVEFGLPGFASELDHVEDRPWSFDLIDRGLFTGSGYNDNSTRFSVRVSERKGLAPLEKYC